MKYIHTNVWSWPTKTRQAFYREHQACWARHNEARTKAHASHDIVARIQADAAWESESDTIFVKFQSGMS